MKISKALLTILLFFVSFQAALLAQPPLAGSNQAEGATAESQKAQLEKQLADAKSAFEKASAANKGVHNQTAAVLIDAFYANGMGAEALALAKEQAQLSVKEFGLDSLEASTSNLVFARTVDNQKGFQAAVTVLKTYCDLLAKELGAEHQSTLASQAMMASYFWRRGQRKDAVELQQAVIAKFNGTLGADSLPAIQATRDLAKWFWEAKAYGQAEPLYELVFPKMKTAKGPEDPQVLGCAYEMAVMYLQTNPAKAVEKIEFTLQSETFKFVSKAQKGSPENFKLLLQDMLGQAHLRSGNLDKAEVAFQSMLTAASEDEQFVEQQIKADAHLALILQQRGQLEAASEKMKGLVAKSTEKLGKMHPATINSRESLYEIYSKFPAADKDEKAQLATSLFDDFLANKFHLLTSKDDPKGLAMVSVITKETQLFTEEDGKARIVGTVEEGEKMSVFRYHKFSEVYVPKLERRCWLWSQDATRVAFSKEATAHIFVEAVAAYQKATTSSEKINIIQKQISTATDEIEAHPVIGLFYGDLASEYKKTGDSENAIKYLRKSVEMLALKGHDDGTYLNTRSLLARSLPDDETHAAEAKQIFKEIREEVAKQFKDTSKDHKQLCGIANGTIWEAVWRAGSTATPEQVSLMRKVITIDPKGMYFNTLGAALFRVGKFEQAIEAFEQSIQKTPGEMGLSQPHPSDFAFTAMCHHRLGNDALSTEFKAKAESGAQQVGFKDDSEIIAIIGELRSLFGESKPSKLVVEATGP